MNLTTFIYKARDDTGKPLQGTLEAVSREETARKLRQMGYIPTQIKQAPLAVKLEIPKEIAGRFRHARTEEIILFIIQLANMINAGLPIVHSLNIIMRRIENKKFKEVVTAVKNNIEAGSSLSEALANYPRVFSKLFVNSVRAGETSGQLNMVLNRLAVYIEQQENLKQKIKGALFYPIILLLTGITVILLIVTFVMPQFVEIFTEAEVPLPFPTLLLYRFGTALKNFWHLIILLSILCIIGLRFYIRLPQGRLQFDQLTLNLPVIGGLVRKVIVSRFSRTLATLVDSGVPILQSLDITRDVVNNEVISRVIGNVRDSVEKGERIAQPLRGSEEFPEDAVQMIAVGEETGKLGHMLNKVADFYDASVEYSVRKLTVLIEPVFLVIMGALTGLIMASLLLPIFDMIKTIRH